MGNFERCSGSNEESVDRWDWHISKGSLRAFAVNSFYKPFDSVLVTTSLYGLATLIGLPKSADLSVFDFFLWGHLLKSKLYTTRSTTVLRLKTKIRKEIAVISAVLLQRAMQIKTFAYPGMRTFERPSCCRHYS